MNIIDNMKSSMSKFIDDRQHYDSINTLRSNTTVLMPNGFRVFCEAEQKWYQMSCSNPNDPATYEWTEELTDVRALVIDCGLFSQLPKTYTQEQAEEFYTIISSAVNADMKPIKSVYLKICTDDTSGAKVYQYYTTSITTRQTLVGESYIYSYNITAISKTIPGDVYVYILDIDDNESHNKSAVMRYDVFPDRGSSWFSGTGITGTSTEGTVFQSSGVDNAIVGDMYMNTSTSNVYTCVTEGTPNVAKWSYSGSIKGMKGDQGVQGIQGIQGIQGVSTTNVEINEENHLILTLSDSTIIDAGEIINDVTNYENLNNKPKINGIELIGNKSTSDLGIEIPTVTNDLTNVLKSNYDTAYAHSQSAHAPSNAEANVQSDWNETDNTSDAFIKNKPTSLPASDVSSWAKATNKPTYTASEVGLGNVDNTSDLDKPISNAASTALGNKVDKVTGKGLSTNDYTNAEKDNIASAFKYTKFEGNAIKFYNTQSITSSSVPTFTIDLPVDWVLDLSQTTLVQNFIWSDELYPNSTNPNLDGLPVLVLVISDNTNATYSFLNMNTLIDVYVGGNTNSASVAVNDTTGEITCNVKVSSVTNNAITTKSDGLHVDISSKANIVHNHTTTDITDFPTSMPASDVSSWAKATDKPTYSKSEIGLSNVPNVTTNDQTPTYSEASTLATLTSGEKMSIAFGKIKKAITSLISHTGDISNPHSVTKSQVGLGNVDNTSDANKPVSTATQTALDIKASTTALTEHTNNNNIHVTAEDKTAWNKKYVLPTATADLLGGVKIGNGITITDGKIGSTCTTKTYGKAIVTEGWYRICDLDMLLTDKTAVIMLSRNYTNTANEAYIISFCYSHNKPVFNLINSSVGSSGITKIRVVYNSNSAYNTHMYLEMYYALNVLNTVSSAIFYNSAEAQRFIPVNFTAGEIPSGYGTKEFDLTNSKLLTFSPVPATLTSTGTAGEIAYDTNYMYICTATNIWKKLPLGTAHEDNTDIHVTSADKTAWNLIPKSKSIDQILGINVYKDFVVPLTEVTVGVENTYFYGQIFLKRTNNGGDEITIINAMCGKRYNKEEATYSIDSSEVFTPIKPCIFTYNSKKYFGIHVNITSSEYEIFRVDARTTTNYNDIKMIFIYDTSTSQIINAEIYNSLNFAAPGKSVSTNFYEVPQIVDSNYVKRKLLYFSPVPASETATGTKGDIAYDTSYMYICTATNIWKKLPLGTAHEDNTDIHVTSADKTAWNGALISKADTTAVNTALDLKANLTDLDEVDNKTVFIGRVEPARTSALWIQNNVSISITETEFIDLPQTNFIYVSTMSISNQPDGNYGILYVPIESNAKYRICKQAGHSFRIGTTTSIPKTGTVVNYTTANHTGDQITITTGNTDKYLVIVYWYYTNDPETTKEQMRSTITIDEIGNTQIHYLDNGNYLPLITSDTVTKSQPRNLIGKNILFIGDSITEKNYRTAKNYHDYLAEWFGFKNINKGVSGTGYMDNETFGLGWYNKLLNGFYPSTGVEGIVIMGAINDRYHSVGTYGDSTATTLFGTLKLMYEELITRYPKIPILIITSTPRRYSYGDSGNDGTLANYHGHVDAVIQMAKEYSFPCFDLYRNSGLRPWNTTNNTEYFTADGTGVETGPRDADGVHPNSKGHKIMAQKLFEFINSGLNL